MTGIYQWRGSPWPHRIDGHGGPVGVEDYPFQGLGIRTEPYGYSWLASARCAALVARSLEVPVTITGGTSGEYKHPGRTPFGTPIAQVLREGHDILAAPCGYCGFNIGKCPCRMEGAPAGARIRPTRKTQET